MNSLQSTDVSKVGYFQQCNYSCQQDSATRPLSGCVATRIGRRPVARSRASSVPASVRWEHRRRSPRCTARRRGGGFGHRLHSPQEPRGYFTASAVTGRTNNKPVPSRPGQAGRRLVGSRPTCAMAGGDRQAADDVQNFKLATGQGTTTFPVGRLQCCICD